MFFVTNKMKNETKELEEEHEDEGGGKNDVVNSNHLYVLCHSHFEASFALNII